MNEEIIERIKCLYIDCPECEGIYNDEQYTCTTCWCQGGQGVINVFKYLQTLKK